MSNENNTMDYFLYDINVVQSFSQFDWTELAIVFVFFLISCLGLIGNIGIIIAPFCLKLRRLPAGPTNVFLSGLATADVVLIIFCILIKMSFIQKSIP